MLGLRGLQIERHAQEVMAYCAQLSKDFGRFRQDFDVVGKHIGNAASKYSEADRRARQLFELPAIGDPAQIGNAAVAEHGQQPVGRTGAERGNRGLTAGFALGCEVIADRLEQHDVRVGAFGCETAGRASAGIEGVALARISREG